MGMSDTGDQIVTLSRAQYDTLMAESHELEEARSEIGRHHTLIAWMRSELEWAIPTMMGHPQHQTRTATDFHRAKAIRDRLNREVG